MSTTLVALITTFSRIYHRTIGVTITYSTWTVREDKPASKRPSTQEPPAMQLTYRGQAYQVSAPAIEAMEIHETASFLGKPYARKQFFIAHRAQPIEGFTYRGVRYTR